MLYMRPDLKNFNAFTNCSGKNLIIESGNPELTSAA
jgi:hypothetical protein